MSTATALRVLVVDDERTVADSVVAILRSRGHLAWAAYSAEEATALAQLVTPDAAISDVVMPGMNGIDLANWLEQNCPDCRVLPLSGDPHTPDIPSTPGDRIHGRSILAKPVHPETILQFVANRGPAPS